MTDICKKCGKALDHSDSTELNHSPQDYCKDCEMLIYAAKDLDELIDIHGFGAEFSAEELYNHFENEDVANSKISLMIENDLLIKDQLSGNFHLSDIVSCTGFINENKVDESEEDKIPKKSKEDKTEHDVTVSCSRANKNEIDIEIKGKIKADELGNAINQLNFFIINLERMEVNKIKEEFEISIRLNINVSLLNKFEDKIKELGWKIE